MCLTILCTRCVYATLGILICINSNAHAFFLRLGYQPLFKNEVCHFVYSIPSSHIFNLVNIHLFHDDDNLTALEVCVISILCFCCYYTWFHNVQSPSVYCAYRKKALECAIQSVNRTLTDLQEPVIFYGDFNFRLDFSAVMRVCFLIDVHTYV